jgi:hypothetical protein
MAGSKRSLWSIRSREARGHAVILACISWLAAAVIVFGRPGDRDLVGHLKGADFVHFYTLGRIALDRQYPELFDQQAQHELQAQLVPDSAGDLFVPIYPPQTALIFAPFAMFSYGIGALLFAATNVLLYALIVRAAWLPARSVLSDATFVIAATAGFPPFWSLVLHGQTTAFPLAGFCLGWIALERQRPFLAGLALGLITIKPQFGLVLAVVAVVCGEWWLVAGVVASVAAQMAVVWLVMGPAEIIDYLQMLRRLPEVSAMLEPRPYQLHSIRAITNLLPSRIGTPVWALASAATIVQTVRVWRRAHPVAVRFGVLVLATVLVSPHLTIYDATVLILPLIWIGGWLAASDRPDLAATFWPATYWLVVTLFIPTALFIRVQLSVIVLAWMFVTLTSALITSDRTMAPTAEVA